MLRSIDCPDFDCAIYDTCGKIENIRCQCLAEFVYCGFECPCNVCKKKSGCEKNDDWPEGQNEPYLGADTAAL